MRLRMAWLTMMLSLCLVAAFAMFGCVRPADDGDGGGSTKTIYSGNTINNNGACSSVIVINGLSQLVKGTGGSTITVGNTTITFSPDCSTVTTTTAADHVGLGRLPSS